MNEVRCPKCQRLVGKASGGFEIVCPRCKARVEGSVVGAYVILVDRTMPIDQARIMIGEKVFSLVRNLG